MHTQPATHARPPDDPRLREICAALRRVQNRLRWREAFALMPKAMALGGGAGVVLVTAWRIEPGGQGHMWLVLPFVLGLMLAAVLTVTAYALLRPRSLMSTARRADRMLSLDERLTTALEDATRPLAGPDPTPGRLALLQAQLDDALTYARRISPDKDLPIEQDARKFWPVGAVLALLLAVLAAPDQLFYPFTDPINRAARHLIAVEKQRIEEVKRSVESLPRASTDPTLKELLEELSRLSQDLSDEPLSREEAIARLSEAESELQKVLDPQAPARRQALDQLARQLAASPHVTTREAAEALRQGNYESASEALKKTGEDAASMTAEERRALAESFRKARDSVVSLDPELAKRLSEASDALESSDARSAQQALENLGQQVQDTGQKLASQEQVRQALAHIQQSRSNIAQAGHATPVAGTPVTVSGTLVAGSPIAIVGSPVAGTPISGTPVVLGSPVSGRPAATGTPVLVPGQGQEGGLGGGSGNASGGSGNTGGSNSWGRGHIEPVYAPPTGVDVPLTPVAVPGQDNPTGEQSSAVTNSGPNVTGEAQVPYDQVYGQYRERAGRALDTEYIPQGYKDLVRDYFTSIEP